MRYAPVALGVFFLAGCTTGQPMTAAQHVPRPHTCDWYKPFPRAEGTTQLAFLVDVRGRLQDITVTKSSGSDDVDQASTGCAARWKYYPAMQDGKPVETRWSAQIDWRKVDVAVTELGPPH
jgi:TonB family protein